jgi:hypothetical protein
MFIEHCYQMLINARMPGQADYLLPYYQKWSLVSIQLCFFIPAYSYDHFGFGV